MPTDDNTVRKQVTSSSDVAQRMGELVQRADASKDVVSEAANSLVEEVSKMTKQIGVFRDYIDEIKDNGGQVSIDSNGTGATITVDSPELSESIKEQTEESKKVSESFSELQKKIIEEQEQRNQKVEEFLSKLDEDRQEQAKQLQERDDNFYNKMYDSVVRQSSATSQQDSFDKLVQSYDAATPSAAQSFQSGANNVTDYVQTASAVIDTLSMQGTRGISSLGGILSKAGGALSFLGPIGAALGAGAAGINLFGSGVDMFQNLRSASLEATGSGSNLNVGIEQGLQSKLTEFTTSLSENEIQQIQSGLMSGGATYGSDSYTQGYDWVVSANQNRGLSVKDATQMYIDSVVRGGLTVDDLNEKLDSLAEVAENTGASMSAVQQQYQTFSNTFEQQTGSVLTGQDIAVDFTRYFGDETGDSSKVANSVAKYAQNDVYFQNALLQAQNNGMDTGQAYAYAIGEYADYYSNQGTAAGPLIQAVLNGDKDEFVRLWNEDQNIYRNHNSIMQELSKVFYGGEAIPVSQDSPEDLFDFLSDPLVNDVNRAAVEAANPVNTTQLLDTAKSLGGSTEGSMATTDSGAIYRSGMSNYVSGLDMNGERGSAVLQSILGKSYDELSDDEKAVFLQSMALSGEVSEDQINTMTNEDINEMFNDVSWSYNTYGKDIWGNPQTASSWLENDFTWDTKDQDWFSNATRNEEGEKTKYEIQFSEDASKMFYLKAMDGKEQLQSDGEL